MYIDQRFFDAHDETLQRLSFMLDYESEPLVTLEEATKYLDLLVYNCDLMVLTAKRIMSYVVSSLTIDEAASIYLYTMWSPKPDQTISVQLNRVLRRRMYDDELIPWLPYLKLFSTALKKLSSTKRTVWRYARGDMTRQYLYDCIWLGFSSCTGLSATLENFINKNGSYTVFEIDCINGKSISRYCESKGEDEVILMPGTHLRVINKEYLKNGVRKIYLQEIGPYHQYNVPSLNLSPRIIYTHSANQPFRSTSFQSNSAPQSSRSYSKHVLRFLIAFFV